MNTISQIADMGQCDSVVVVDHTTAQARLAEEGCQWRVRLQDYRQYRPTRYDKREVFEWVSCSEPLCKTCTDIADDDECNNTLTTRNTAAFRHVLGIQALQSVFDQSCSQTLLLLPRRVCAYSLEHHAWMPLNASNLRAVETDTNLLDRIHVSEVERSLIRALGSHYRQTSHQTIVYSKLHPRKRSCFAVFQGPPGIGKSFAAEAASAAWGLPLMRLSLIELGSDPSQAWAQSVRFLYLATRWRCAVELEDNLVNSNNYGHTIGGRFLLPC